MAAMVASPMISSPTHPVSQCYTQVTERPMTPPNQPTTYTTTTSVPSSTTLPATYQLPPGARIVAGPPTSTMPTTTTYHTTTTPMQNVAHAPMTQTTYVNSRSIATTTTTDAYYQPKGTTLVPIGQTLRAGMYTPYDPALIPTYEAPLTIGMPPQAIMPIEKETMNIQKRGGSGFSDGIRKSTIRSQPNVVVIQQKKNMCGC